jgi:hypothetical protein
MCENNTLNTTVTCSLSPNPASGDTLVFATAVYNCTSVTHVITDNQTGSPNTYTLDTTPAQNISNLCVLFFHAGNITVNTTPFVVTLAVNVSDYLRIHSYDVNPGTASGFLDAAGTTSTPNSAGLTGTTNNVVTSNANDVIFGAFSGNATGITTTAGTGYTLGYSDQSLGTVPISLDSIYRIVSSTGTFNPNVSWSLSETSGYASQGISIKGK